MQFRKVDLRLVWTVVLLACLFGGIMPGAPASSSSSSTTTTGPTTTTTTGPTTTAAMAPSTTTTTTESQEAVFKANGIIFNMGGISKTQADGTMPDVKTVFANQCSINCRSSKARAQLCCGDTKSYSPTSEEFLVANNIEVHRTTALATDSVKVEVYARSSTPNALCAIGTMSRRKRAIANGYVSAATLFSVFTSVQTQFATAYSAAASATLGTPVTVTVTGVALAHSSSVKASGWIITLMVLVSALVVLDFDWKSSSVDSKQAKKEDKMIPDLKERQLIKPTEAFDTDGLITAY